MDVHIDTLRLRVGGIGEDSARRLADLIAQRLSLAPLTAGSLGGIGVTVQAHAGDTLDGLADSASTAVLRTIPASGGPARRVNGREAP